MESTVLNQFHKLGLESGIVHEEGVAVSSTAEGVKAFLDQFEGDNRTAAAIMIAAVAAQDIQEGSGDLNWTTNPEAVASLVQGQNGLETLAEIAESAEQYADALSSLAAEVGTNQD